MIEKKDIKVGFWFTHYFYKMKMRVVSFSPGHESHLGMITLSLGHFTWTGSLREFLSEFTKP